MQGRIDIDHDSYATFDEGRLSRLVRYGDMAALDEMIQRTFPFAAAAARAAIAGHENGAWDADDIVATVFTRVIEHVADGNGVGSSFRQTVIAAVHSEAADIMDHEQPSAIGIEDAGILIGDPGDLIATTERGGFAIEAFEQLPERMRTIIWHTEVEGRTTQEVADIMGITSGHAAVLAFRGRAMLRRCWNDHPSTVTDAYEPEMTVIQHRAIHRNAEARQSA